MDSLQNIPKRQILILLIAVAALFVGIIVTTYFLSRQQVQFSAPPEVESIVIYKDYGSDQANTQNKSIEKLAPTSSIRLQDGLYYAVANGGKLAPGEQKFTVSGKKITVTLTPAYSKKYLAEILISEQPVIEAAIKTSVPEIGNGYSLQSARLYQRGDWYGVIIAQDVESTMDQPDFYRLIVHKQKDKWIVQSYPKLVYLKSDYPNIPENILNLINTTY